jgi:hypothetical protein
MIDSKPVLLLYARNREEELFKTPDFNEKNLSYDVWILDGEFKGSANQVQWARSMSYGARSMS